MILVLVLCALLVRLWAAGHCSAYLDEALTYYVAAQGPAAILVACKGDFILPGFYLPLWPLAVVTDHRVLLRLPSAFSGAIGAGLVVLIGRRLGQERAGWAAGWLYALAYPVWLVEAQIRLYGLLDLLILLTLWCWLERRRRAQALVFLGLPWVHVMGTATVAGWGLIGLWRRDRKLLLSALLGLAMFSPWLLHTLSGSTAYFNRQDRPRPSSQEVLHAAAYLTGIPAWLTHPLVLSCLGLVVLGCLVRGLLRLPERGILVVLLMAPLSLAVVAALRGTQEFQARYLVPVAALAYLAAFNGLPRRALGPVAAVLAALNLVTGLAFPWQSRLWNQDWDSVARFIRAYERPGDAIAVYTPYSLLALNYAYVGRSSYLQLDAPGRLDMRQHEDYRGCEQIPLVPAALGADLEGRLRGRRVFLVLNQEGRGGEEVRTWFGARYHVERELQLHSLYSWGEIAVYLLRPGYADSKKPPRPGTAPPSAAP